MDNKFQHRKFLLKSNLNLRKISIGKTKPKRSTRKLTFRTTSHRKYLIKLEVNKFKPVERYKQALESHVKMNLKVNEYMTVNMCIN